MPRATKEELLWAYAITREQIFKRMDEKGMIPNESWDFIHDSIFNLMCENEKSIYDYEDIEWLENTIQKYLYPSDDYISLTDIARKFEAENPSYLIQSWLRSRNTIEFLAEWERNNNPDFNESAFKKLIIDVRSPSYTLTPLKWIDSVNAIGIFSKRGKNGCTMAHPFIACDFEMWNDMKFRYEMIKHSMDFMRKGE